MIETKAEARPILPTYSKSDTKYPRPEALALFDTFALCSSAYLLIKANARKKNMLKIINQID